jgi:hypothetical protein
MSIINDYLNGLRKKYPSTVKVAEQIEELRDSLHNKTEEYQSRGMAYEEAAQTAIASLGDVSGLFEELSGNVRTVYVNRLNRDNCILCTSIILAEFLLGWALAFLFGNVFFAADGAGGLDGKPFWYSLIAILLFLGIGPLVNIVIYRREPGKTEAVNMPYKRLMHMALIGWGIVSAVVFAANAVSGFGVVWFVWPVIGVSNWPLNIWNYHRQLTSGKYDA